LRRGFKALAERDAQAAREALGLSPAAPLDPWAFAKHLSVVVVDFAALGLPNNVVRHLTVTDTDSWSAMTLRESGVNLIVVNPAHAPTRQRSDLMHELAHIQLGHVPTRVEVSLSGLMLLSDFSDEQEQEADWHSAAMLVPRDILLQMRANHFTLAQIAAHYGVSETLCEWRLRMTGVDLQMRRARGR
jgi:Zn-dependent peptidase ImmA (M78 family)